MSNELVLFRAIGEVDDRFVLELEEERTVRELPKKIWRTALLAAVITALLAVTAYASGLLGLHAHLIRPSGETRHEPSYLSLGGERDSAEFAAAEQWLSFTKDYAAQNDAVNRDWRDLERGFSADQNETAIARLYGVWDRTMLDKLLEIAAENDLALHTSASPIPAFPQGRVYENGAFALQTDLQTAYGPAAVEVYTERRGTLSAEMLVSLGEEGLAEWSYTTASGKEVAIVAWPQTDSEGSSIRPYAFSVFATGDYGCVTLRSHYVYDSSLSAEDQLHAYAEAVADAFDYAALCDQAAPAAPDAMLR